MTEPTAAASAAPMPSEGWQDRTDVLALVPTREQVDARGKKRKTHRSEPTVPKSKEKRYTKRRTMTKQAARVTNSRTGVMPEAVTGELELQEVDP